jgi:hypothetical protein
MDSFEHSFAIIWSCPLAQINVCVTSSSETVGEKCQKMVKKLLIFGDCFVSWCFPTQHSFLFYFLQQILNVLEDERLLDILQDPRRIFNADETSFEYLSKTGNVLACNGDKNVYEVGRGLVKASIRVVLAFSTSGIMRSPVLIYPYKRIPSEITQRIPDH